MGKGKDRSVQNPKPKTTKKYIDPYEYLRRDIPPPGYVIGGRKYQRKKQEELEVIEEGLEDYFASKLQVGSEL